MEIRVGATTHQASQIGWVHRRFKSLCLASLLGMAAGILPPTSMPLVIVCRDFVPRDIVKQ
ncbi:hypothetical protein ABVT39_011308 [Epinephelus coioides]